MKFAIITHVTHIHHQNHYFGYAPYVREMNLWLKHVDEVLLVAPLVQEELSPIHLAYQAEKISFRKVAEFNMTNGKQLFLSLFKLPAILFSIFKAMREADHIHLRCPGNMGLLGALVQILFPKKKKTAKYAGNWDPKAKQPFTYKLQRWILSSPFLTKNMQVLVYGEWPRQSQNVKSFFTASYGDEEIQNLEFRSQNLEFNGVIKFLFVGTLSKGKQPLYALQLINELIQKGYPVSLDFYGEGNQSETLLSYVASNDLDGKVIFHGNQSKATLIQAYQTSHFLLLPSKSEGWPKAVAEAMFWECLPVATKVSCVPYMLGAGSRGILLDERLTEDVLQIEALINNPAVYLNKVSNAVSWSRQYTIPKFEEAIKQLL